MLLQVAKFHSFFYEVKQAGKKMTAWHVGLLTLLAEVTPVGPQNEI